MFFYVFTIHTYCYNVLKAENSLFVWNTFSPTFSSFQNFYKSIQYPLSICFEQELLYLSLSLSTAVADGTWIELTYSGGDVYHSHCDAGSRTARIVFLCDPNVKGQVLYYHSLSLSLSLSPFPLTPTYLNTLVLSTKLHHETVAAIPPPHTMYSLFIVVHHSHSGLLPLSN